MGVVLLCLRLSWVIRIASGTGQPDAEASGCGSWGAYMIECCRLWPAYDVFVSGEQVNLVVIDFWTWNELGGNSSLLCLRVKIVYIYT